MTLPDEGPTDEQRRDAMLTACAILEQSAGFVEERRHFTEEEAAAAEALVDGVNLISLIASLIGLFHGVAGLHPDDAQRVIAAHRAAALEP
jgi:hypothetical protein